MWQPLKRVDNDPDFTRNPAQVAMLAKHGLTPDDEIWINDRFQVLVRYLSSSDPDATVGREGMMKLSIHSHDRGPMRNWRYLQQIKNEVAGEERTAVEFFPPESNLVDTSNEYHLFVFPEGTDIPFMMHERIVSSEAQTARFNQLSRRGIHRGRQEPWEQGLTVGGDREGDPTLDVHMDDMEERNG